VPLLESPLERPSGRSDAFGCELSQLKGEGINDLWIAACCLVHKLPLVTGNLSDFETIAGVAPALQLVHPDL
jgi:predicted nucleic acid-binding protein